MSWFSKSPSFRFSFATNFLMKICCNFGSFPALVRFLVVCNCFTQISILLRWFVDRVENDWRRWWIRLYLTLELTGTGQKPRSNRCYPFSETGYFFTLPKLPIFRLPRINTFEWTMSNRSPKYVSVLIYFIFFLHCFYMIFFIAGINCH